MMKKRINRPNATSSIHSPFRYAGGKYYARKLILEHIREHSNYVEPFCGGASIFFCKPKVEDNWLNDIDEELINVLSIIRDYPSELVEVLRRQPDERCIVPVQLATSVGLGEPLPATKELHTYFKKEFRPRTPIERALRWYYLNRTSYSGIMNYQNMYWGYGDRYSMQPKNWAANIERASAKLQNVRLTHWDFEKVIDEAADGSFLFLDPPYFSADQDKFYQHFFSREDHNRLRNCLLRNRERLNYLITYDNVPQIREMYQWANEMYDKEWNYCIQRTDDQKTHTNKKGERYKGKELFIVA